MTPRLAQLRRGERAFERLDRRQMADVQRCAFVVLRSPADAERVRSLREHLEGALTCHEAERAISRAIDGRLAWTQRKRLERHLRDCADCAGFDQSQRAQRSAWKLLAGVPLPPTLQSFFGPGGVPVRPEPPGVPQVPPLPPPQKLP